MNNRDIFDQRYDGRSYAVPEGEDFFGRLVRTRLEPILALPRDLSVLDVGCGHGSFLLPLAEAGFETTGLDFSPRILAELEGRRRERNLPGDAIRLIEADASAMPLADASFDVALSFAVLYAVPELESVLAEIGRVLRPGGRAFLDLGAASSLNAFESACVESGLAQRHLEPGTMRALLRAAGLRVLEERHFQIFPCWSATGDPRSERLAAALREGLRREIDGRMLDELVSSALPAREFAFRHVFHLERSEGPDLDTLEEELPAPGDAEDRGRAARRGTARALCAADRIEEGVALLTDLLAERPADFETVVEIAALHRIEGAESLVERMRRRRETSAARPVFAAPAARPLVSVVLPTYNQRRFLPEAVTSVLTQTLEEFELIVVDDGSTDGSAAWLDELSDRRVRVIHQENRRLPSALNRGFELAQGRYLTWTSSDNACTPGMLASLVEALERHPEAGLAASGFAWIDEEDRILRVTRDQDLSLRSLLVRNPGLAAFLYRADLAREVGDYDPQLEGAEDWDYWIRLVERRPAVLVRDVLYLYREHAASMTGTMPERVRESSRRVFERACRRRGEALDLGELFPWIEDCRDREAALADACHDLGARLLVSPFCDLSLSERFLAEAARRGDGRGPRLLHDRALATLVRGREEEARALASSALDLGLDAETAAGLRAAFGRAVRLGRAAAALREELPAVGPDPSCELLRRERRPVLEIGETLRDPAGLVAG